MLPGVPPLGILDDPPYWSRTIRGHVGPAGRADPAPTLDQARADEAARTPIVDTHLHVWDQTRLKYSAFDGSALFGHPYHVEDYQKAFG